MKVKVLFALVLTVLTCQHFAGAVEAIEALDYEVRSLTLETWRLKYRDNEQVLKLLVTAENYVKAGGDSASAWSKCRSY